jgi:RimJ/RimL family protein N-acetyltransferase
MSSRVLLRDVIDSDLPIFFDHQRDAEATQMAAFPARDRDTFMTHWGRIMHDQTNILKTILFEGKVAGNIVSWEESGQREVGYWIGKEFWGKGIATRALSDFLGVVETRPLYAHVARHNLASRRVLEKCGFTIWGANRILSDAPADQVEEFVLRLD